MALAFDHVFVLCRPGAPEAEAIAALGLTEGPPNDHPGQGSACRRFMFGGAYLELLYLRDRAEAATAPAALLGLVARADGGCPIGIAVRTEPGDALPFDARPYTPAYLPPGIAIPIATASADPGMPLVFASPFPSRSTGPALSRVTVHGPWSPELRRALSSIPKLVLADAAAWSVDIALDDRAPLTAVTGLPLRIAVR